MEGDVRTIGTLTYLVKILIFKYRAIKFRSFLFTGFLVFVGVKEQMTNTT